MYLCESGKARSATTCLLQRGVRRGSREAGKADEVCPALLRLGQVLQHMLLFADGHRLQRQRQAAGWGPMLPRHRQDAWA